MNSERVSTVVSPDDPADIYPGPHVTTPEWIDFCESYKPKGIAEKWLHVPVWDDDDCYLDQARSDAVNKYHKRAESQTKSDRDQNWCCASRMLNSNNAAAAEAPLLERGKLFDACPPSEQEKAKAERAVLESVGQVTAIITEYNNYLTRFPRFADDAKLGYWHRDNPWVVCNPMRLYCAVPRQQRELYLFDFIESVGPEMQNWYKLMKDEALKDWEAESDAAAANRNELIQEIERQLSSLPDVDEEFDLKILRYQWLKFSDIFMPKKPTYRPEIVDHLVVVRPKKKDGIEYMRSKGDYQKARATEDARNDFNVRFTNDEDVSDVSETDFADLGLPGGEVLNFGFRETREPENLSGLRMTYRMKYNPDGLPRTPDAEAAIKATTSFSLDALDLVVRTENIPTKNVAMLLDEKPNTVTQQMKRRDIQNIKQSDLNSGKCSDLDFFVQSLSDKQKDELADRITAGQYYLLYKSADKFRFPLLTAASDDEAVAAGNAHLDRVFKEMLRKHRWLSSPFDFAMIQAEGDQIRARLWRQRPSIYCFE